MSDVWSPPGNGPTPVRVSLTALVRRGLLVGAVSVAATGSFFSLTGLHKLEPGILTTGLLAFLIGARRQELDSGLRLALAALTVGVAASAVYGAAWLAWSVAVIFPLWGEPPIPASMAILGCGALVSAFMCAVGALGTALPMLVRWSGGGPARMVFAAGALTVGLVRACELFTWWIAGAFAFVVLLTQMR